MEQFAKETHPISIEQEMRRSYLDYAMSVIVGRALPDVRDGLKPVHRRVLFAMHELSNDWNKAYKKSARIVGDVIGKYHPHGDTAVYDTIVRMAQDFSLRYPLVDGQGNFGSVDGDNAAAMRYTEIRMAKIAHELLADLEKETVDFGPNYDGSEHEPLILPARFPNLLVNGSSGIAVGMATNIPPHNLGEVIDACFAVLGNPDIDIEELINIVPAPDFPTRGIIYGTADVKEGYRTGRGRVVMRARAHVEDMERAGKQAIVVDELPYQVGGDQLLKRISELVHEKKIEGIADLRNESRQGRHAPGDRAQARRGGRDRAEQPVQAHADAGDVRHEHGRVARRPAEAAQPQAVPRRVPAPPPGSGHAAHGVRPAQGARARARARGPRRGALQRGRGDRDHQGGRHAGGRQGGAHGAHLALAARRGHARPRDVRPVPARRTCRRTSAWRATATASPTCRRSASSRCSCSASPGWSRTRSSPSTAR